MLYHIRFFKVPSVKKSSDNKYYVLKTVLSLPNDLGDEFFHGECDIQITIGKLTAPQVIPWKAGMRSCSFEQEIPFSKASKLGVLTIQAQVVEKSVTDYLADVEHHHLAGFLPLLSEQLKLADKSSTERRAIRSFEFQGLPSIINIAEETGESIAKHLWDGAIIGTHKLLESDEILLPQSPKNILELGSGCGLLGIALAKKYKNADIVLTDLDDAEEICKHNLSINNIPNGKFHIFDWNEDDENITKVPWDLVVVADCIYNDDSYDALTKALIKAATKPDTRFIMANKYRHPDEANFFVQLKEYFDIITDVTVEKFGQPVQLVEFRIKK